MRNIYIYIDIHIYFTLRYIFFEYFPNEITFVYKIASLSSFPFEKREKEIEPLKQPENCKIRKLWFVWFCFLLRYTLI